MTKIFTLLALLLVFSVDGKAQEAHCHTNEFTERLLQTDPDFVQQRAAIVDQIERWTAEHPADQDRAVLTIPVVVHVVYNSTSQNISDAQILSQIDVLNEDYRKLNADVAQVQSVWTSLVADCEIEFRLAVRDPNGAATNGITRTETTVTSFDGDEVKHNSQGGKDAWPAADYLNIWVCNLGSGLLGYTYPPGVSASIDGLVIKYNCFGRVGSLSSVYNKGRTSTHEVGHYLNLEHLWGSGAANTNCNADDGVSDTPKQDSENFGCPAFPQVSCSNGPNGDMFMNYMDYTNDVCMFFFTNGQKTRMRAALQGARASLLDSDALIPSVGEMAFGSVQTYPNPANDYITVVLGKNVGGTLETTILDVSGRLVWSDRAVSTNGNRFQIDLANIPPSTYLLKITGIDGVAYQRIVVAR